MAKKVRVSRKATPKAKAKAAPKAKATAEPVAFDDMLEATGTARGLVGGVGPVGPTRPVTDRIGQWADTIAEHATVWVACSSTVTLRFTLGGEPEDVARTVEYHRSRWHGGGVGKDARSAYADLIASGIATQTPEALVGVKPTHASFVLFSEKAREEIREALGADGGGTVVVHRTTTSNGAWEAFRVPLWALGAVAGDSRPPKAFVRCAKDTARKPAVLPWEDGTTDNNAEALTPSLSVEDVKALATQHRALLLKLRALDAGWAAQETAQRSKERKARNADVRRVRRRS